MLAQERAAEGKQGREGSRQGGRQGERKEGAHVGPVLLLTASSSSGRPNICRSTSSAGGGEIP